MESSLPAHTVSYISPMLASSCARDAATSEAASPTAARTYGSSMALPHVAETRFFTVFDGLRDHPLTHGDDGHGDGVGEHGGKRPSL